MSEYSAIRMALIDPAAIPADSQHSYYFISDNWVKWIAGLLTALLDDWRYSGQPDEAITRVSEMIDRLHSVVPVDCEMFDLRTETKPDTTKWVQYTLDGETWVDLYQIIDGEDGEDGEPGEPGATGATGATGAVGPIGQPGQDGEDCDCSPTPYPDTLPEGFTEANNLCSAVVYLVEKSTEFYDFYMEEIKNDIQLGTVTGEAIVGILEAINPALELLPIDEAVSFGLNTAELIAESMRLEVLDPDFKTGLKEFLYCQVLNGGALSEDIVTLMYDWIATELDYDGFGDILGGEFTFFLESVITYKNLTKYFQIGAYQESAECFDFSCAEFNWCYVIAFDGSNSDYIITQGIQNPSNVSTDLDFFGNESYRFWAVEIPFPVEGQITSVKAYHDLTVGSFDPVSGFGSSLAVDGGTIDNYPITSLPAPYEWTGTDTVTDRLRLICLTGTERQAVGNANGESYLTSIEIRGTGINPFGASNC